MDNRILVKVSAGEDSIAFRTVTKQRKSPHWFYILRSELNRLWECGSIITKDIHSFAQLRYESERKVVSIRFIWLGMDSRNTITGWEQTVRLPCDALAEFLRRSRMESGPKQWHTLSLEERKLPKLEFHATDNLRAALSNQTARRRLVRFLRDHFCWHDADRICFYNDCLPYSFFFREFRHGRPGICGGVILHNQENMNNAYYALHT